MSREEFIYLILCVLGAFIIIAISVPLILWLEEKEANIHAKAYKEVIFDSIDKLDMEDKK
jgi:hypothetical protein